MAIGNSKISQIIELITKIQLDDGDVAQAKKELRAAFEDIPVGIDDAEFKKEAKTIVDELNKTLKGAGKGIDFDDLLGKSGKDIWATLRRGVIDFVDIFNQSMKSLNTDHLENILKQVTQVNKTIQQTAKNSAKSVTELDEAISRLGKKKSVYKDINNMLSGKGQKEEVSVEDLNKLHGLYTTSVKNKDPWEIQYQHMLKYFKAYEKFTTGSFDGMRDEEIQRWKIGEGKGLTNSYEKLASQIPHIVSSLQNVVNRQSGAELVDDASKPWARESTLQAVLGALQGGLKVTSDDNTKPSEKQTTKETPKVQKNDEPPKVEKTPKAEQTQDAKKIIASQLKTILKEVFTAAKDPSKRMKTWDNYSYEDQEGFLYEELQKRIKFNQKLSEDQEYDVKSIFRDYTEGAASFKEIVNTLMPLLAAIDGVDIKKIGEDDKPQPKAEALQKKETVKAETKTESSTQDDDSTIQKILAQLAQISQALGLTEPELKGLALSLGLAKEAAEAFARSLVAISDGSINDKSKKEAFQKLAPVLEALVKEQQSSTSKKPIEYGTFYNSQTGEFQEIVAGKEHSARTTRNDWKKASEKYDTRIHTHNSDIAAPSFSDDQNDFVTWLTTFDDIKKHIIKANTELLSFDFSSLNTDDLKVIADKYTEEASKISKEFDGYQDNKQIVEKFGSLDNFNEQYQIRLREVLETIMAKYPGVMTSYKLPDDMIINKDISSPTKTSKGKVDLAEKYANASDEVKELIRQLAILEKQYQDIDSSLNEDADPVDEAWNKLYNEDPELAKAVWSENNKDQWEQLSQELLEVEVNANKAEQAIDELNKSSSQDYDQGDATDENAETQAIEQQNDALEENINLQKQQQAVQSNNEVSDDKAEALVIEKVNDALEENIQLQKQADNVQMDTTDTEEVSNLDRLEQKVKDVVSAIESKTQAFRDEESVVDSVVASEVASLERLESKITEIKTSLANIKDTPITVDGLDSKVVGDTDVTKVDADKELKELQSLRASLKLTTQAVNSKTDAFVLEGNTVGQVIGKEISGLIKLQSHVSNVNESILELVSNLKNVKTAEKTKDTSDDKTSDSKTKEKTSSSKKKSEPEESSDTGSKATKADLTKLASQYASLGKMRAQFEASGNREQLARLQNLADEVSRQRESLGLTKQQISALREQSQVAYKYQQRIEAAAQEQKIINDQRKASDQQWKDEVKAARAYNGVNAANSAVTAGSRTVTDVIGDESISKEIEAKARELQNAVEKLSKTKDEVNRAIANKTEFDSEGLARQTKEVRELTEEMNELMAIHKKYSGDNAKVIDGDASAFKDLGMDEYEKQLTKFAEASVEGKLRSAQFNAETKELTATVKTGANSFTTYSFAVDKVDGKLKQLNQGTKQTESFFEGMTRKTKELAQYALSSISIYDVWNQIRNGIQYVREIDTAMTELRKVTDESEASYAKFLDTASQTGARIGSTITDFTQATATFAKLGYDMNTASDMAEAAIVYQNVGDGIESAEAAAESLISTMKGFGLEASNSMAIVDSFNEVGNSFAIDSKGIGDALMRSASAMSMAGNSMHEAIGLATAANTVVNLCHAIIVI